MLLWVVMDSNHRRHRQQIYSLPHLATLVTTRFSKSDAKVCFYFENKECFSNYLRLLTKNPFLFC